MALRAGAFPEKLGHARAASPRVLARTGASRTQSGNDVRTTSPRLRGELRLTLDTLSHYSPVFTAPLAINSLRRRVQFFLDAAPEAGPPAASTAGVGAGAGPRSPAIRCASRTRHRLRNRKTSGTSGPMRPNILIGSTGNHEVGVCYSCFDAGGGQQHRSIPTPSSNPASRASDSGPRGRVLFCIYRNHCWAGPVYDTKNAGCMTHSKTKCWRTEESLQVTGEI